jgi:hypothetical protein
VVTRDDGGTDFGRVRVAELIAALSLGIDLGFGQPMEHVLRQCLIALKLAEHAGLDEESRAVVYYTALLVQARNRVRDIWPSRTGRHDRPSCRDDAAAG